MKIFDFNIHLPCHLFGNETNKLIANENTLTSSELQFCYETYLPTFKKYIQACNIMLFNQNIHHEHGIDSFIKKVKQDLNGSLFTSLIDFRRDDALIYLDKAIQDGIDAIKFHSYSQKITKSDFSSIINLCKYAEAKGLIICIDTSFGTSKMYDYDNLKLACSISEFISKAPIVLLHSGGARVLQAMLLAEDKKNIFLETSFSIPYYLGSSIEKDFAFAYKKIGVQKILYGSDSPYVDLQNNIGTTLDFLQKYNFASNDIQSILFKTAAHLKNFND